VSASDISEAIVPRGVPRRTSPTARVRANEAMSRSYLKRHRFPKGESRAATRIGEVFGAEVVEIEESGDAKAVLHADVQGVTVHLRADQVMLFDRIKVRIGDVSIPQAFIQCEFMEKLSREATELA